VIPRKVLHYSNLSFTREHWKNEAVLLIYDIGWDDNEVGSEKLTSSLPLAAGYSRLLFPPYLPKKTEIFIYK
jgi:hypothetical protein